MAFSCGAAVHGLGRMISTCWCTIPMHIASKLSKLHVPALPPLPVHCNSWNAYLLRSVGPGT